jgi:hypothetical protein
VPQCSEAFITFYINQPVSYRWVLWEKSSCTRGAKALLTAAMCWKETGLVLWYHPENYSCSWEVQKTPEILCWFIGWNQSIKWVHSWVRSLRWAKRNHLEMEMLLCICVNKVVVVGFLATFHATKVIFIFTWHHGMKTQDSCTPGFFPPLVFLIINKRPCFLSYKVTSFAQNKYINNGAPQSFMAGDWTWVHVKFLPSRLPAFLEVSSGFLG